MKPIDINRHLGARLCKKNLTGEGWRGVTGDRKWKGGPSQEIKSSRAQAGRGVLWALAGSLDSILRPGGVAVLVGTRTILAETNKSLFCSLEKKVGAAWLLNLVPPFVGLSSGLSACVV